MNAARRIVSLALAAFLAAPLIAEDRKPLSLPVTLTTQVPFAKDAAGDIGMFTPRGGTKSRVEDECGLQVFIPETLVAAATKKKLSIVLSPHPEEAQGRVLGLIIEGVLGGGGAMSLTLRGELKEGDLLVGSFVSRHRGGSFGGNCEALRKTVKDAAQDIVKWLKEPTLRARLGEA
jgi:hypothetical protein